MLNRAEVAVPVATTLMFTKLTVPTTTELIGAIAGKPTKLTLISATEAATLNVAVLFAKLISLIAPVVAVPCMPVVVWVKLIDALIVKPGATLPRVCTGKVTAPVLVL